MSFRSSPSSRPVRHAVVALVCLVPLVLVGSADAQDPAAERLFDEARRLEQSGDQNAALDELELLVQQFPNDALAPRALLTIAELRRARGDEDGAHRSLSTLFSAYPRSAESAAGFVLEADIRREAARSTEALSEARKSYRRVPLLYGADRFPTLEERVVASLRGAEIALDLGDSTGVAADLVPVIEEEPPGPWRARARLLLARAWIAEGEWQAAAEQLGQIATDDDGGHGDAALATDDDRETAKRWLALLHRHVVRPAAGGAVWTSVGRYPNGGPALREPSGVAAASDGRVLAVDRRSDQVYLLDPEGRVLEQANIDGPRRPGWSGGRWPYVVTDKEIVLPFHGQRTNFLEPRPDREIPLKGMGAAVRGRFGDWFVLARGFKGLLAYESRRRGSELLVANRLDIQDLAQDPIGRPLILDGRTNQIGRLTLDRQWDGTLLGGNWRRPEAIDCDPLGKIYVLDRGNATVEVYTADGRPWATVGPVLAGGIELKSPVDLAVDGSGRLFIADSKLPFLVVLE